MKAVKELAKLISAFFYGLFLKPPRPSVAQKQRKIDCSIPGDAPTATKLRSNITGGVLHAKDIKLPIGRTLKITSTLILVADQNLIIDGDIEFADGLRPAPDIILVSKNKDVVINGSVGESILSKTKTASGIDSNAQSLFASASGGAGYNAGYIKIIAPKGNVDIQGTVIAGNGGKGGWASATGVNFSIGGSALAAAGQGGRGGDIYICALDSLNIGASGEIRGGMGGGGGVAQSVSKGRFEAYSEAGPNNDGGDVFIEGEGSALLPVINAGLITGGSIDGWGVAVATARPNGSNALAIGREGGRGGTVFMTSCEFAVVGTVNAGQGGHGGDAEADGGMGNTIVLLGYKGGNATARGGNGGKSGPIPQIPVMAGGTVAGGITVLPAVTPGFGYGSGGSAMGTPGAGGPGGLFKGGDSGKGDFLGGEGVGGTPPIHVKTKPVLGTRAKAGAGGVAVFSSSAGTP